VRPVWMVHKDDIKFLYWFGRQMSLCSLGICVPYTNVCIRGIQSLVEGRLKTQASSVGSKVFRGVTSMCYPDRPLL
jgi:hypothetical protein